MHLWWNCRRLADNSCIMPSHDDQWNHDRKESWKWKTFFLWETYFLLSINTKSGEGNPPLWRNLAFCGKIEITSVYDLCQKSAVVCFKAASCFPLPYKLLLTHNAAVSQPRLTGKEDANTDNKTSPLFISEKMQQRAAMDSKQAITMQYITDQCTFKKDYRTTTCANVLRIVYKYNQVQQTDGR